MSYQREVNTDGVQQVVDDLADRLGRSVAVDDTRLRLLVVSRHFGDEDGMRVRAVMARQADPAVADWIRRAGIESWTGPGRIPANAELEIKARCCIPIRDQGRTMAYLFLIDEALADDDVEVATAAAVEIGRLLRRRLSLQEREQGRAEALVGDLVDGDAAVRTRAEQDAGLGAPDSRVLVAVVEVHDADASIEQVEVETRTALDRVRRATPGFRSAVVGRRAILLWSGTCPDPDPDAARKAAHRTAQELPASLGRVRTTGGIGSAVGGPGGAAVSYDQALVAIRTAGLLPDLGEILSWDELGVFGFLVKLPPDELAPALRSTPAWHLLHPTRRDDLLATAEAYLDAAGDAAGTAAELHIHRSTLYYRLQQIERVTGADLHSGRDRLALHLGLKLHRLAGAHEGR